jgi:hypothetical protein
LDRDASGKVTLYTKLRACFGFFCRNVNRVERVDEEPHALTATVVPERSDVREGSTRTELAAVGNNTRVVYRTRVEPGFWVPALGRRWMLNTLKQSTIELFEQVELQAQRAQSLASGEQSQP